jgi:hypothetical protein
MIKRTLIAIAVIAFLANAVPMFATTVDSETYPPFAVYSFSPDQDDDLAIKVDGKATVRWPFEYKYLEICKIPVKMKIGMYIRVKDCDKSTTKIILVQKDCDDAETVGKAAKDWPCYYGCVSIQILSNFNAQIRGQFVDRSDVINGDKYGVSVTPNTIVGDGNYHSVDICVKTWLTKIEKAAAGDEVTVGNVSVQARPEV